MYHQSKLFQTQIALQLILIVIVYWFSFAVEVQAIFCGILLCTVGIPHGSNDHLYRPDKSIMGMFKFLSIYLGTMLLYLGLWWIAPLLALILFFVISFHHFGQSNFENESLRYLPSWLWGMWVLVFPVLLHLKEATGIFQQMLASNNLSTSSSFVEQSSLADFNWPIMVMIILGAIYLVSLIVYERQSFFHYFIQFGLITLWYFVTPLLFGFIIFFCLWHALQSMRHQAMYFKQSAGGTLLEFLKAMLPFSLLALLSFGVYVYFRGFQIAEAFILLSMITLPHVLVMHRLYHKASEQKVSN
ncbi:MAG: Brp/Blh family beta-carotene 15,15'-dioxygenase [Cyclobacteriaceae bacterium]